LSFIVFHLLSEDRHITRQKFIYIAPVKQRPSNDKNLI